MRGTAGAEGTKSLTVPSSKDNLYEVQGFVEKCLKSCGVSPKALTQLELII